MIVLFTDFGLHGPYVGQMKAVLHQQAAGVPQVDLFHDVPAFDIKLCAYLLAAYVDEFPAGTVFLCVVDPGVGTSTRQAVMLQANGRWFVGPGNGLFNLIHAHAQDSRVWEILWRPQRLSHTFHGRDLFAPVAALLAMGQQPEAREIKLAGLPGQDWPNDLTQVIYLDHFGNAMTGKRAAQVSQSAGVQVSGQTLAHARTFAEVPPGQAFWYENANGLLEIAVNKGNAAELLQLQIGDGFSLTEI